MSQITTRFVQDIATLELVRKTLGRAVKYYPGFYRWWDIKVLPGILSGQRFVCLAYSSDILAGIMVLKNTEEKKISSLYVFPEFRDQGVGTALIQVVMRVLRTNTPVISVPEPLETAFTPLLQSFGFQEKLRYPDYYMTGITEIAYNGYLTKEMTE